VKEAVEDSALPVDELEDRDGPLSGEPAPRGSHVERGGDLRGAAQGDAVEVEPIAPGAALSLGDVESDRAGRASDLVGERAVVRPDLGDGSLSLLIRSIEIE
jgi:hypothetical protein